MIRLIKEKWWIFQQFHAIIRKEKRVARVLIAKLNREKDNLPSKINKFTFSLVSI